MKSKLIALPGPHPTDGISMNSKFDQNLEHCSLKHAQMIATKFYTHVMAVTLSWHVQNFVVISRLYFQPEHFKFGLISNLIKISLVGWGPELLYGVFQMELMLICINDIGHHDSDNSLLPIWYQAIIWTNAGLLLIGLNRIYFNDILFVILMYSFKKIHFKMSMAAILSWPQCVRPLVHLVFQKKQSEWQYLPFSSALVFSMITGLFHIRDVLIRNSSQIAKFIGPT